MTTIKGLDRVTRKLDTLQKFSAWAYDPMDASVKDIQRELAKYPAKAKGAFTRYATPGQRRAYWAKVRSGEANHREGVGYVRSGTIGRKWTSRVENSVNGVRGVVGNNAPGAEWVQQASTQQPFHKASGWPTDVSAIRLTESDRNKIWSIAIRRVVGL